MTCSSGTLGTEYKLFVGLNDQFTNTQKIPTQAALKIVERVCLRFLPGFTITQGKGGYKDAKGNAFIENSFTITVVDVPQQSVKQVARTLNRIFNQSSILIVKQRSCNEFFTQRIKA